MRGDLIAVCDFSGELLSLWCLWCPVAGSKWMAWSYVRRDFGWILGRGSSPRAWLSTGTAKWSQHCPDRVQEAFGECCQAYGVTLEVSCAGPGARLQWSLYVPSNSEYSMNLQYIWMEKGPLTECSSLGHIRAAEVHLHFPLRQSPARFFFQMFLLDLLE